MTPPMNKHGASSSYSLKMYLLLQRMAVVLLPLSLALLPPSWALGTDYSAQERSSDSASGQVEAFISKWDKAYAAKQKPARDFALELCDLLQVSRPHTSGREYRSPYFITVGQPGGPLSSGCIDIYKRGSFLWMNTTDRPGGSSSAGGNEPEQKLEKARRLGLLYATYLEDKPPFLLVADVGRVVELYADFTGQGKYAPYSFAGQHRIFLEDLRNPDVRELLRAIWQNPQSLAGFETRPWQIFGMRNLREPVSHGTKAFGREEIIAARDAVIAELERTGEERFTPALYMHEYARRVVVIEVWFPQGEGGDGRKVQTRTYYVDKGAIIPEAVGKKKAWGHLRPLQQGTNGE